MELAHKMFFTRGIAALVYGPAVILAILEKVWLYALIA
jgi:hypothetical protein